MRTTVGYRGGVKFVVMRARRDEVYHEPVHAPGTKVWALYTGERREFQGTFRTKAEALRAATPAP